MTFIATLSKILGENRYRPLIPLIIFVSGGVTAGLTYGGYVLLKDKDLRTFRNRYNTLRNVENPVYASSTGQNSKQNARPNAVRTNSFLDHERIYLSSRFPVD
jgi:hypothetical protein